MSKRTTPPQTTDESGVPTLATITRRPPPKRKFAIKIGGMEFDKRCTVMEARNVLAASDGADVLLLLDGGRFRMIDEE
jgi:hypothetical protein